MAKLVLGLDASTQSLTAALLDPATGRVCYTRSLNYSRDLPHYGTQDGVLRGPDPTVIHAPPLLWLEALDLLFAQMKNDGVALGDVFAISGSGQQHGSVYLNASATSRLAHLDPQRGLAEQLAPALSRPTSPIWMDSSTTAACADITRAMAEHSGILAATGSAAMERFTGPQIRKFWQQEPAAYAQTQHIALVSSFLCSVLSGRLAPIDPGDGAGMNLMDIQRRTWHPAALSATAPDLAKRLPPLANSGTVVGPISPYFVARYGFSPTARSVIWSGDNPCSVVGLGLVQPGLAAISMGTSYTYFGTLAECQVDPRGEGHVFGSPAGGYMTLNCFKNGGLARARIRDLYGLDWAGFAQAMATTPPGNRGRLMLPWFDTEIVPRVLTPGVHRRDLSADDVAGNCRAVVEAQMMTMCLHAGWMKLRPTLLYATGGASEDRAVLQVMADVFQCPVQRSERTNSAAVGAALIAAHATEPATPWSELLSRFTRGASAGVVHPDPATAPVYRDLMRRYAETEQAALRARAAAR